MALKKPVPGGASYEVAYQSDPGSKGATLVVVLWIPKPPATVPSPKAITIAPGATATLQGTVPSKADALLMEIRVDLPDGIGSGTLTLMINGAIHSQEPLVADTTWTALVHP